jgi:hypothetical protein
LSDLTVGGFALKDFPLSNKLPLNSYTSLLHNVCFRKVEEDMASERLKRVSQAQSLMAEAMEEHDARPAFLSNEKVYAAMMNWKKVSNVT